MIIILIIIRCFEMKIKYQFHSTNSILKTIKAKFHHKYITYHTKNSKLFSSDKWQYSYTAEFNVFFFVFYEMFKHHHVNLTGLKADTHLRIHKHIHNKIIQTFMNTIYVVISKTIFSRLHSTFTLFSFVDGFPY